MVHRLESMPAKQAAPCARVSLRASQGGCPDEFEGRVHADPLQVLGQDLLVLRILGSQTLHHRPGRLGARKTWRLPLSARGVDCGPDHPGRLITWQASVSAGGAEKPHPGKQTSATFPSLGAVRKPACVLVG